MKNVILKFYLMATHFGSANASVYIITTGNILVLEFRGFLEDVEYKNAYEKLFEIAKEKKIYRIVLDLSRLESSSARVRNWLKSDYLKVVTDIFSEMNIAIVKSQSTFQLSAGKKIQMLVEEKYKHFKVQSFDTFVEATTWLMEQ